jgi:sigma-54-interacting transcriptional regulator
MSDTARDAWLLDQYQTEFTILRTRPLNVLLEGSVAATDAVVRLLWPHLRGAPVQRSAHTPLDLPNGETRGLILRDVAALSAGDQAQLSGWLATTGSHTQVISVTERPLFTRVAQGRFDAALYYRLNVLLWRLDPPHTQQVASPYILGRVGHQPNAGDGTSRDV